jgi:hypothetical protein
MDADWRFELLVTDAGLAYCRFGATHHNYRRNMQLADGCRDTKRETPIIHNATLGGALSPL